jgi:hypothetical protein
MMSFDFSSSCGRLKNVMCQKVSFVLACFQASAAPRPENPNSDEKDALFGLDTQMTTYFRILFLVFSVTKHLKCRFV